MKKFLMFLFLLVFIFSLVSLGLCGEVGVVDREKKKQAERDIQRLFPSFKVETMVKVPITEFYLVVADDGAVILYSPAGYVFLGDVWNMKGESLIAKIYEGLLERLLDEKDGRFYIKVGNGKHKVIAFLSPGNEEGRNIYKFLKEKKGLDFYVFLLADRQKDVELISYVYCARDRVKALDEVFEGKVEKVEEECKRKAADAIETNLRVAKGALVYSEGMTVLIGDKRIIGFQPFEIMKALYFVGWREEDGRKETK
jgi:hypothetical protein